MKVLVSFIAVLLLLGCASAPSVPSAPQNHSVTLRIEGVEAVRVSPEGDQIVRTMVVESDDGELSGLSFICGDVMHSRLSYGLTTSDYTNFENDLFLLRVKYPNVHTVYLVFNSPGGDAFQGLALADLIRRYGESGLTIEMHAAGVIASAAVPVFASGTRGKRYASRDTIFMVHEPSIFKYYSSETASNIKSQHEMMQLLRNRYLDVLDRATTLPRDEWEAMEGRTQWFFAEKALEYGLVDELE